VKKEANTLVQYARPKGLRKSAQGQALY